MSFTKLNKTWGLAGTLVLGLAVWSCEGALDLTGLDGSGDPIQLSREMTLGELQDALISGAARVEIELIGDGLVAHRVVLGYPEAIHDEEEVESRVTGLEVVGADGILALMLGDLTVTFDPETHFRVGDDELGFEAFVDRVEGILAEDFEPWIKARRPAPEVPQDPTDAAFHAWAIKLMEDGEEHELEVNIGEGNFQLNSDPQDGEPDGWLNVLGMSIELRVSDGITELATKEVESDDEAEFEGFVHSVDLEARTFTFTDGTVVKLIDGTTMIFETEFQTQLLSLEAVDAALKEGHDVVAWGCGELESKEPRVIVALELRFAIHGDGGGTEYVEFEGYVTSVNFDDGSFTLTNGTIVKIREHTELITQGDGELLGSLEEVDAALMAGYEVIAWGAGEVESAEPLTIIACEMRFLLKSSGGELEGFEGHVDTVDLEGFGSFTLTNGTVVHMLEGTMIKQAEQGESLMSLAAVQEARQGGNDVIAWGEGELEGTEPRTISALKVFFVLAN